MIKPTRQSLSRIIFVSYPPPSDLRPLLSCLCQPSPTIRHLDLSYFEETEFYFLLISILIERNMESIVNRWMIGWMAVAAHSDSKYEKLTRKYHCQYGISIKPLRLPRLEKYQKSQDCGRYGIQNLKEIKSGT